MGLLGILASFLALLEVTRAGGGEPSLIANYGKNLPPDLYDEFQLEARRILKERLEVMKEIVVMPEDQPHYRMRRQSPMITASTRITRIEESFYDLVGVTPYAALGLPLYKNIKMAPFDDYLLVSVVTGEDLENQNKTIVYKVHMNATVEFLQMLDPENLAVQTTTIFHSGNDVQLALAGDNGVLVYEWSHADNMFLKIQQLPAMDIFLVEQMYILDQEILILGLTGDGGDLAGATLAVYRWMGGYFDKFFEYSTPHICDICPYEIQGHYFLAVAVQEAGKVDYPDSSFILRYDQHTDAFVVDQYISTHGARDFEFFSISSDKDQEFFLVLANDQPDEAGIERSVVYKYVWHMFVPFQCFETHKATKWQPVMKSLDMILILSSSHGIVFYQYDGWRFTEVVIPDLDVSLEVPIQSFSAVSLNDTQYLGISSTNFLSRFSRATIFQLEFNVTNPLEDFQDQLEAACRDQHALLDAAVERIENITSELPKLVYVDMNQTQEVSGNITFNENVIANDSTVEGNITAKVGHIFNETEAERFEEMEDIADEQSKDIDWLEERMDNMMKTVGVQTVIAEKTFYDFTSTSELDASSIAVTSDIVNGYINLTDVNTNIFRGDQNTTITVPITVNGSMVMEDDLEVKGQIDGVLTDDLVTLTGNHTIVSSKTFESATSFSGDVTVDGKIDGIDFTAETLLLTSTNQTIAGNLTFEEPVTFEDDVKVDGKVDGIDISEIEAISVYKNGTFVIAGIKTFEDDVNSLEGLNLSDGKTIDSVSVEEMDRNILRITTEQNVTGTYTFTSDVHIVGDILVIGTINDLVIPDDILLSDSALVFNISGLTTFTSSVGVSDLTVEEFIDGIAATIRASLSSSRTKRSLDGPSTDSAAEAFPSNIRHPRAVPEPTPGSEPEPVWWSVGRGLDIPSFGLCRSGWLTFGLSCYYFDDEPRSFTASETECVNRGGHLLSIHSEEEQSFISENLNSSIGYFIGLNDVTSEGMWEYTDGSQVNFTNWQPGKPASLADGDDCVQMSGMDAQVDPGLWADVDCNNIKGGSVCKKRPLAKAQKAILTGLQNFLRLSGAIDSDNGKSLDLLLVSPGGDADQVVSGQITLTGDLVLMKDTTVGGLVDTVDLSELSADAVRNDDNATITGFKTITGLVTFDGDITVQGVINDVDIADVNDRVLRITNADWSPEGGLIFTDDTTISSDLETSNKHSFNGIVLTDLALQGINETIGGWKTFQGMHSESTINLTEEINGVSVNKVCREAVYLNNTEAVYLFGDIIFEEDLDIDGNLTVNGTIDGVDLEDVVTVDGTQTISSSTAFYSDVEAEELFVNSSVHVNQEVNGENVTELALDTLYTHSAQTVTGHKVFLENAIFDGDLELDGSVNDVDISDLALDAVYKTGDHTLSADKTFTSEAAVGSFNIEGSVNGENFTAFSEDIVLQDEEQTINGDITFGQTVRLNSSLIIDGTLNGVNITDFDLSVHKITDDEFTGKLNFADVYSNASVSVDGLVNGIDVGDDTLITNEEGQTVTGSKTFTSSLTLGDDLSSTTVNGINVTELDAAMLKTVGDQNVTGYYKFWDGVTWQSNATLHGLIDGVDIVELANSIWRTDGDTDDYTLNVTGNGTFNILTSRDIYYNGTIDGVDIPELNRTYVSLTFDQTITSSKRFLGKVVTDDSSTVTADHINVEGSIDDLDLKDISDEAFISGNAGQELEGELTFVKNVTFEGDVTVDGTVDGVDISDDVMVTDATNIVRAHKTFNNSLLEIDSSLNVQDGKKVQQVDVSEMKRLSADVSNNYTVPHNTTFKNVTLPNLSIEGLLNGINYTTGYVLTEPHDQFIYGNYTFTEDVVFEEEINVTTINGLDVVDLATNTLFTTGDQTVTSNITINGLKLHGNVTTHGLFGGIHVREFYESLHYYPELDNLSVALDEQCEVLDELYYAQQNQAVLLRGLERIGGEVTVGNVLWVPFKISFNDFVILAVSPVFDEYREAITPDVCAALSIKRWDVLQRQYQQEQIMTFDLIEGVAIINTADIQGIVVAERTVDGSCFNASQFSFGSTELRDAKPPGYTTDTGFWVYVLFSDENGVPYHQRLLGVGTSTVEVIDHPNDVCIFVGNEVDRDSWNSAIDSFIYCYNPSSWAFEFANSVSTFGVVKVSTFSDSDQSYLLIANRVDTVRQSHKIDSTLWRFVNSSYVQEVAQFPTRAAVYVMSGEVNGMRLIVFLNEFQGSYMFENFRQNMDVYRFQDNAVELYQQIPTYGAKAATFIKVHQKDFLAVIDRNGNLTLYKYEGMEQFVEAYTLHVPGATDIAVASLTDQSAIHLFVATALAKFPLFPWQPTVPVPSPSDIYQVVLSGHILDAVGCSSAHSDYYSKDPMTSMMSLVITHLLLLSLTTMLTL